MLFQRGWEHDGLKWGRQDAPALVEAAPDRRNNAHLVLHPIEERWSQNYAKAEYEFHQSSAHPGIRSDEKEEEYRSIARLPD